jgi:hypothetical protein
MRKMRFVFLVFLLQGRLELRVSFFQCSDVLLHELLRMLKT